MSFADHVTTQFWDYLFIL